MRCDAGATQRGGKIGNAKKGKNRQRKEGEKSATQRGGIHVPPLEQWHEGSGGVFTRSLEHRNERVGVRVDVHDTSG